jgi:hypothetical protein
LLVELILVVLIFVAFAIRTSWFQTYLAQEAASYLSNGLGKEIRIDKIDLVFIDGIDIKGVYAQDTHSDTLLYAGNINVSLQELNLEESFLIVDNVTLENTSAKMKIYKGDSTFNFQHLIEYFTPAEKDTTPSDFDFGISVNSVTLKNVNYIFEDQNAEPAAKGIDYTNLNIKNVNGDISNFGIQGDSLFANLEKISFTDQSGLDVRKFSGKSLYHPNLIQVKDLEIILSDSYLKANVLQLVSPNGVSDYGDFLNQVKLNIKLRNSDLSLADISYFVPQMWGMTDRVKIVNCDAKGTVNGMKLKHTDIRMLNHTIIQGDFQIPNLDDINNAFIDERVELFQTSIADVERLNLSPFLEGKKHIKIPDNLKVANIITLKNGHFTGVLNDFVVDGDFTSGLGNVYSDNGLKFTKNTKDGLYYYQGVITEGFSKDVIVENLDLGALASNAMLGKTTGYLKILKGTKGFAPEDMNLKFKGHFESVFLNDYVYSNINIRNGEYGNERFTGVIDVEDDNLALNYNGFIDFKDELIFDFDVKIDSSYLTRMKIFEGNLATNLKTKMKVNLSGSSLDRIKGDVRIDQLHYFDGENKFDLNEELTLNINRSDSINEILVKSSILDAKYTGDFHFDHLIPVIQNQLGFLLSNYINQTEIPKEIEQSFSLEVNFKDINGILDFFSLDTYIEPFSTLNANYDYSKKALDFKFDSEKITYQDLIFRGISLNNNLDSVKGSVYYFIESARLNDSISIRNLYFDSYIKSNKLLTNTGFDGTGSVQPALFAFDTQLTSNHDVVTKFSPSFFHLGGEKWDINPESVLFWNPDIIKISNFDIVNLEQLISFNGTISKDPKDWLNFRIKDFDLSALNRFFDDEMTLNGQLNIDGGLADLYGKIRLMAISDIKEFSFNKELVGDILLDSKWDQISNSVKLLGNLKRDSLETFTFFGDYFVEKEEESLDIFVSFDKTDIGFLNAFSDEEMYTHIEGILDGDLHVGGVPVNPIIQGDLEVLSAKVKVPMFNVDFGLSGMLSLAEGEILADNLSVYDQEGHESIAMLQIYHYDWSDWNYDITLDMEDPSVTETFLVMNTEYKEGDVYYGKAYVTGNVNIAGYDNLTNIAVNAKTKKGTALVLPLYGTSDLEKDDFIQFYDPRDTSDVEESQKIKNLGMTLAMDFDVTDDAQVKIVFDPLYNDEIEAEGAGNIKLDMDTYGEMKMYGLFNIDNGVYHMNMKNVVAEDFEIMKGSTVGWDGSPYDANIGISTRFERSVDMSDIIPTSISSSQKKDQVFGYLNLSNTLMKPELSFDIQAPKAKDEAKKALNQIRGIEDELNKQFFALLMIKKFISVNGESSGSGGGNVATDLINQQVDAVLGKLSDNYALKSNIEVDKLAFGIEKSFLDDKLKVTTSVGVMSSGEQSGGASNIVGDVDISYELNEDGTFNISVFNETNETSADQDLGHFTQGVGVNYQESFNSRKDFKVWQGFLNIFRKSENDVHLNRNSKSDNGRRVKVQTDFDPAKMEEEDNK